MPRLTLALRLIRLRARAQLSQRALERLARVGRGTVTRIESGAIPRATTVSKLAHALGVQVCALYPAMPYGHEEEHAHAS